MKLYITAALKSYMLPLIFKVTANISQCYQNLKLSSQTERIISKKKLRKGEILVDDPGRYYNPYSCGKNDIKTQIIVVSYFLFWSTRFTRARFVTFSYVIGLDIHLLQNPL
jgi:hypothetical protein